MPLTPEQQQQKQLADFIDLLKSHLDGNSGYSTLASGGSSGSMAGLVGRVDDLIPALRSLLEPEAGHKVSPEVKDKIESIADLLDPAMGYAPQEGAPLFAEFKSVFTRKIREKIEELNRLSPEEKAAYEAGKAAQLAKNTAKPAAAPQNLEVEEDIPQEVTDRQTALGLQLVEMLNHSPHLTEQQKAALQTLPPALYYATEHFEVNDQKGKLMLGEVTRLPDRLKLRAYSFDPEVVRDLVNAGVKLEHLLELKPSQAHFLANERFVELRVVATNLKLLLEKQLVTAEQMRSLSPEALKRVIGCRSIRPLLAQISLPEFLALSDEVLGRVVKDPGHWLIVHNTPLQDILKLTGEEVEKLNHNPALSAALHKIGTPLKDILALTEEELTKLDDQFDLLDLLIELREPVPPRILLALSDAQTQWLLFKEDLVEVFTKAVATGNLTVEAITAMATNKPFELLLTRTAYPDVSDSLHAYIDRDNINTSLEKLNALPRELKERAKEVDLATLASLKPLPPEYALQLTPEQMKRVARDNGTAEALKSYIDSGHVAPDALSSYTEKEFEELLQNAVSQSSRPVFWGNTPPLTPRERIDRERSPGRDGSQSSGRGGV